MAALGRIGQSDDIAKVVLFLVSDEAGWISTRQNIQLQWVGGKFRVCASRLSLMSESRLRIDDPACGMELQRCAPWYMQFYGGFT